MIDVAGVLPMIVANAQLRARDHAGNLCAQFEALRDEQVSVNLSPRSRSGGLAKRIDNAVTETSLAFATASVLQVSYSFPG